MHESKWPIKFVGRHNELDLIKAQIQAWDTKRFVFVDGPGGIGKTRLLDEIGQQFADPADLLPVKILPIIDFDDDRYKFSQNIGISIGRQLNHDAFEVYFEMIRDLRLAEERAGETGSPLLGRKFLAINREFSNAFNSVSKGKRVVLRFDTTEAVSDSAMMSYVFSIAVDLENTTIILAGRNGKTLYEQYEPGLGDSAILIPLLPFGPAEFHDYREEKKVILGIDLEDEWLEKLFLVAGGIPVLVDMAIEWAQTNRRLKWLDELSLDDLAKVRQQATRDGDDASQNQYGEMQRRLREEIVMPIAELQSEFDYLQFLLARIYPLDLGGIMAMLDLDRRQAQKVMNQASQSVAIKRLSGGWIKLHDEIQDLVIEYVWPRRDPDKEWEQRDSRRAIEYLTQRSDATLQRIQQLKYQVEIAKHAIDPTESMELFVKREELEVEFWTLRLESLRRQLALDVKAGFQTFEIDFRLAQTKVASSSARISLIDTITPYAQQRDPKRDVNGCTIAPEHQLSVMRLKAKQLVYIGNYDIAAKVYDQLLGYSTKGSESQIELLNGKANALLWSGRFREALSINSQALILADKYPALKTKVALHAGWFNRRMGNLDQAIEHYAQALELALYRDDEESIALAYQNQAYVHALQDKERLAMEEVKLAIRMWPKLIRDQADLYFSLGQAYNIAGEVSLEFERPREALEYFELSWNVFVREESGKAVWRAVSRSGTGFAHWQLAVLALKNNDTQEAERELTEAAHALEWAARNAVAIDAPQILNRLAEVYYLQRRWDEARINWQESMQSARQIGDAFNELHSLSDLARLAFYYPTPGWAKWTDFQPYNASWRKRYQTRFGVLEGLFSTYLGHLALKDHSVDDAVNLYGRGLIVLAEYGTYTPFNLVGQLDFIGKEILPCLSVDEINLLSNQLQTRWIEGRHDRVALGYFREWRTDAGVLTNAGGDGA